MTSVPCGYESKHRPQQVWEQKTFVDFLPTSKALVITTQAIDEVAGIMAYWIAGKL